LLRYGGKITVNINDVCFFTDYITFPELSTPAQTLYEHMTRHIKDHGMKVIAMTPTVDADIDNVSCLTSFYEEVDR